jgi:hypothetical protein
MLILTKFLKIFLVTNKYSKKQILAMRITIKILILFLLANCSNSNTQYLTLDPKIDLQKSKIGKNQLVKLTITNTKSKINIDESLFGYRALPNLSNKKRGLIYLENKFSDVLDYQFNQWLENNDFRITNNESKELNVQIGYFNFQANNVFNLTGSIKTAVKVTILNDEKVDIFSKWYFVKINTKGNDIHKTEVNQKYTNISIESLLKEIFTDKTFLQEISS